MTANLFEGPSVAVRRALLSVSDKTGLLDLAKALAAHGEALRTASIESGEGTWRPSRRRATARRKAT